VNEHGSSLAKEKQRLPTTVGPDGASAPHAVAGDALPPYLPLFLRSGTNRHHGGWRLAAVVVGGAAAPPAPCSQLEKHGSSTRMTRQVW
jgi:hypothetical protein